MRSTATAVIAQAYMEAVLALPAVAEWEGWARREAAVGRKWARRAYLG